jgi:type IV secretion system protein VirB6
MGNDMTTAAAYFADTAGPVATNFTIFAQVYTALFTPFQGAVGGVAGALSGTVAGWVTTGVVCMLMIWAAAMALTYETTLFDKMITKVLMPAAIVLFILQGHYQQYVTEPATTFAASIGNAIVGNTGGTVVNGGAPFDAVWTMAYGGGVAVYNVIPVSLKGLGLFFVLAIYWVVAGAAVSFAFVLYLVSQLGLYLLIAIGPLFVGFGAFQFTRFLLKGYVSAVASLICAQILVLALLAIAFTVEKTILTPLTTTAHNANTLGMISTLITAGILLVACTVLAIRTSAYAAGICGGIFDSIAPWAAAASMAWRGGSQVASSAAGATRGAATLAARPFVVAGRSLSSS